MKALKEIIEIARILLGGILLLVILAISLPIQRWYIKRYPKGDFYE